MLTLDTTGLGDLLAAGERVLVPRSHAARLLSARLLPALPRVPEPTAPFAWHQWTASLWSDLILSGQEDRIVLNRLQEEFLWAEIIQRYSQEPSLTSAAVADLARLARTALQQAASEGFVDRLRFAADTVDSRAFASWLETFNQRCEPDRLVSSAVLEQALTEHAEAGRLALPSTLHLVGFDRFTPAQERLLARVEQTDVSVRRYTLVEAPEDPRAPLAGEFPAEGEELSAAMSLIRDTARALGTQSPRIAVICPQPGQHRAELERTLRERLAPELQSVYVDLSSTPWFISAGAPLSTFAFVQDALDMLRWLTAPLSLERVGQLILSPAFTYSDPLEARARFDLHSTRAVPSLRHALTLAEFAALLPKQQNPESARPALPELQALARETPPTRGQRSCADWADHVRKLLRLVGWPGERPLSPAEFRAMEAWEGLLDLLATLGIYDSRLGYRAFLDMLVAESRCLEVAPAVLDAPVQVLALSDTEALTFDLVVHLHATEENLPAREKRHPLLPQGVQHTLGIGDPVRAWHRTRDSLASLAQRCRDLVLLASRDTEGRETRLTSLAADLACDPLRAEAEPADSAHSPVPTEPIFDPESIPLAHSGEVPGGVDVLRLQAACGFRAFATWRLVAGDEPARSLGLDARESGSLLHKAMEIFWQEVRTQAALKAMTTQEQRDAIRSAVEQAFSHKRLRNYEGDPWSRRYLAVLETRFTNLLARWLQFELKRSDFTVAAQEARQTLNVGPMQLSVRPDRIDQVAEGTVYVDYKTSYDLSVNQWLDERPEAPQLPAYALSAAPESLKGVAFAQIRPGDKMGWVSLTENPGNFPRARSHNVPLTEQIESWRAELSVLAEAFASGDARVNPKSYPHTCQYCTHRMLCRLDPNMLTAQADEDEELLPEEDAIG